MQSWSSWSPGIASSLPPLNPPTPNKMAKKRDYKAEYESFHGTRKQKDRRNMTNKARRILGLKPGDPREVDHIIPLSKGGTNHKDNLRAVSRSTNRTKGNRVDKSQASKVRAKINGKKKK